jgi:septum formation protein
MKKLILASSSIHRKKLLKQLKLKFIVIKPNIDESRKTGEEINNFVKRLSYEKAMKVATNNIDAIVIGSDEIALVDGKVLGKPKTVDNAKKQLKYLSGKKIIFKTGICVICISENKIYKSVVNYSLKMKKLSNNQIENYIKKEDMLNCAGSIRIEGLAIGLVEKTEGKDPTSIIGLPLIRLTTYLEKLGYDVI